MNRHLPRIAVLLACAILLAPTPGNAGLGDKLKKKLEDKANKKTDDAVDKAAGDGAKAAPAEAGETPAGGTKAAPAGGGGKVSTVSTKFDFVPGDKVLFYDDFTQDELGEFPARWDLKQGTYEVAEGEGKRWLRCVSPDGTVQMKLPAMASLPEFWTLEFDFFGTESYNNMSVKGLGPERQAWEVTFFNGPSVTFRSGDIFSSTPIEGTVPGHHHIMFMARGKALKVYLDQQRLVNVPDMSAEAGMPNLLELRMFSPNQPMIANVRFADGCRPAKDMLAEGKLVTHGIRFATGSDVVLPESAPVLRQVAAYMEANPAVKLQVTGHTDNVGTAASNLDLSKRRAASVAKVLSEQFAVTVDRFATDGKGDTQPMAPNAKPEGRAMNRRVEFAKM